MIQKANIIRRILILLPAGLVLLFAIFYLRHTYPELVVWYKGINNDFYRADIWKYYFFTEKLKSAGDTWCKISIVICLAWVLVAWKLPVVKWPARKFNRKNAMENLAIVIIGAILSLVMNANSYYAFDEVFSAVNFASIPQFQTLSYYVLPNNHILFNILNRTLFFWSDDLVASGRILSMLFYILTLLVSWRFLKKWIDNEWMRWIVLASLALQFPTWGFSGQARGYEMLLFFSCLSLFSFWGYWIEGKTYLLWALVASVVLGMLVLPSFLYWITGLNLTALVFMAGRKKIDWLYIRFTLAGMCMLFMCYLPFLAFSGLSSMTDNQYMKAVAGSSFEFIPKLLSEGKYFRRLFSEWFCFDILSRIPGYFLLLLPLAALLNKWNSKPYRSLLTLYFTMLLSFLLVCIVMKNMAFSRNMLAHGCLVWMVLLIVISTAIKQQRVQQGFMILMVIATVFSTGENYRFRNYGLYHYNVRERYKSLDSCKFVMEPGSSVFLDNESFYWWYMLRQKFPDHKLSVSLNRTAYKRQDYSILPANDLRYADTAVYEKLMTCHDFVIYRRRK